MQVTSTLRPAWELMSRSLFRGAQFNTWISFGVIFFLQSCLESDGAPSGNLRLPSGGGGRGFPGAHPGSGPVMPVIDPSTMALVIVAALIIAIPVVVLALWLGTRGQMMAIRSVASLRAEIGGSWASTRDAGYSLFRFHIVLTLVSAVLWLPIAVLFIITLLQVLQGEATFDEVFRTLALLTLVAILLWIPFAIVKSVIRNFVAPIMLRDGSSATVAFAKFWSIGKTSLGSIVGFVLLRFLFEIVAGVVGVMASYLTCCLGFLPVLHQTLMAPWYVFERAWSLEVLASMGPGFDLIQREPSPVGWYGPYAQPVYPPPPPS